MVGSNDTRKGDTTIGRLSERESLRGGDPFTNLRADLYREIERTVVGQKDVVDLTIAALAVSGHILIEGVPGVAKTLLANSLARSMAVEFRRVQFTVDTLPSDIVGSIEPGAHEPYLRTGPVFTNVLLADEINRAMPKTQSALLEAMQERQVTIGGRSHRLPDPFLVVATQNPVELEATFPLPEAQLDRFLFRIEMGYPSAEDEVAVLEMGHRGVVSSTLDDVRPVLIAGDLLDAREIVDATHVPHEITRYVAELSRATRRLQGVLLGASPRASVHLLAAAKASARLAGRDFTTPDDVRRMARPVLAHRLVLDPQASREGFGAGEAVVAALEIVAAPRLARRS
jgi:MoxR-like ATPase